MREEIFYGEGLPYVDTTDLSGKLIVIEGTDGVGRSTQIEGTNESGKSTPIEGLKKWLEVQGYGVVSTGWTRSPLLGPAIDAIKQGNTLNQITYSILYAADFADRLENVIIPALKGVLSFLLIAICTQPSRVMSFEVSIHNGFAESMDSPRYPTL